MRAASRASATLMAAVIDSGLPPPLTTYAPPASSSSSTMAGPLIHFPTPFSTPCATLTRNGPTGAENGAVSSPTNKAAAGDAGRTKRDISSLRRMVRGPTTTYDWILNDSSSRLQDLTAVLPCIQCQGPDTIPAVRRPSARLPGTHPPPCRPPVLATRR
uniref:Uncharacterized protein n=1 Tax=Mycena chlorophos TaxID=658473 RepID=A0ABQ0KY70_MYCCL|nr:predicted protein [Mycena chlorophos]